MRSGFNLICSALICSSSSSSSSFFPGNALKRSVLRQEEDEDNASDLLTSTCPDRDFNMIGINSYLRSCWVTSPSNNRTITTNSHGPLCWLQPTNPTSRSRSRSR